MTGFSTWLDGSVAIVQPMASLYAFDARNLADALEQARELTQVSAVIVTLESAPLVDRDALDVILRAHGDYQQRGGRIALCSVPASVRTALERCRRLEPPRVFPDLEQALAELSPRERPARLSA